MQDTAKTIAHQPIPKTRATAFMEALTKLKLSLFPTRHSLKDAKSRSQLQAKFPIQHQTDRKFPESRREAPRVEHVYLADNRFWTQFPRGKLCAKAT